MSSYEPVANQDEEGDLANFSIDDDGEEDFAAPSSFSDAEDTFEDDDVGGDGDGVVHPLELESTNDDEEGFTSTVSLFSWRDPWFPNVLVVGCLVVPILILLASLLYGLLGQWWALTPLLAHAFLAMTTLFLIVWKEHRLAYSCWRFLTTLTFWLDLLLLGFVYPLVINVLSVYVWGEPDGTSVWEYEKDVQMLAWIRSASFLAVGLRLLIGSTAILACCCRTTTQWRGLATLVAYCDAPRHAWEPHHKDRFKSQLRVVLGVTSLLALAGLTLSVSSAILHFGTFEAPTASMDDDCDPLDTTECWLPFPSYRHMAVDGSTETGWRVNLDPRQLPPLKGGGLLDPGFLNRLDGFSTMAPILFYREGLKEGMEANMGNAEIPRLMGAAQVAESTTQQSITLLVDVTSESLVSHTAEIDYLDPDRPMVLVIPAQPLHHDHHYAVALVNARDALGELLPPAPGLTQLWNQGPFDPFLYSLLDPDRARRYREELVPTLQKVAPWLDLQDLNAVQVLFDFHTISAASQLGDVRAVRDTTMQILESPKWNWEEHLETIQQIDYDCSVDGTQLTRTIHAELKIPWFLEATGPGHRSATLDHDAVKSGRPAILGHAKFVVHIPCSVRNQPVQAVMEYGHGLFFSREEASDYYLQKMANQQRYVITAMDWRGMSVADLLMVARVLLTEPRLFEAVRDNLIQGYACKYALQHFTKTTLFSMDWFSDLGVRVDDSSSVTRVFYGNSQGGILGAGYSVLSGPTELIDRAVLGVPGTPFALVMSRSSDFAGYDDLLLLNFYNNRHVRFLLSLVQMAWDPVEGSGALAPPVVESPPRTLLQAGLGDPIVTTQAAEALARGYGAHILPNNPRQDIFGIPIGKAAYGHDLGPDVTLTELLYQREYKSLPTEDVLPEHSWVHFCTRLDEVLMSQLTEFVNTGRVLDVCFDSACVRSSADCFS
jgi:hypothetical protein